jgi:hypothetical protein
VNFHAHISTLKDFPHVITVNNFFQLFGCPLVADPVWERAALYQVSRKVSFTVYGIGAKQGKVADHCGFVLPGCPSFSRIALKVWDAWVGHELYEMQALVETKKPGRLWPERLHRLAPYRCSDCLWPPHAEYTVFHDLSFGVFRTLCRKYDSACISLQ